MGFVEESGGIVAETRTVAFDEESSFYSTETRYPYSTSDMYYHTYLM